MENKTSSGFGAFGGGGFGKSENGTGKSFRIFVFRLTGRVLRLGFHGRPISARDYTDSMRNGPLLL